jgi:hypothetical protein
MNNKQIFRGEKRGGAEGRKTDREEGGRIERKSPRAKEKTTSGCVHGLLVLVCLFCLLVVFA